MGRTYDIDKIVGNKYFVERNYIPHEVKIAINPSSNKAEYLVDDIIYAKNVNQVGWVLKGLENRTNLFSKDSGLRPKHLVSINGTTLEEDCQIKPKEEFVVKSKNLRTDKIDCPNTKELPLNLRYIAKDLITTMNYCKKPITTEDLYGWLKSNDLGFNDRKLLVKSLIRDNVIMKNNGLYTLTITW